MNTKQKKINLMKRWIAALRSREYKQGKGNLYRNGEYCCLGVLCDISKQEFNLRKGEEGFFSGNNRHYVEYLPASISKYLHLDSRSPSRGNKWQEVLVDMNDGGVFETSPEYSFKQIANFLEENILPLLENEK